MNICYVFIAEYEQQLGGMPTTVEVVYVAHDGTVQQSRETTDDTIISLRAGRIDTSDALQSLRDLHFPPPQDQAPDRDSDGVILPEHAGPTLLVEVASSDGAPLQQWIGSPDDAPHGLLELVANVKAVAQTVPVQSIRPGQRFLRSQILVSAQVEQLRRAGLVVDINREQLEHSPLLKQAITHERRLIGLPPGEAPYGSDRLFFTYGKSAHVAYNEQVHQIRHLETAEP